MAKGQVSIVKIQERNAETVKVAVKQAIDLVGGLESIVKAGQTVIIKPNLAAPPSDSNQGANTSPLVCKAIADLVKDLGARPIIAESSAVGVDTELAYQVMGYDKLRDEGYEVVDLKKTPTVSLQIPDGKVRKEVVTFQPVLDADVIITVPVMKTHDQAVATLSLKNQKGLYTDKYKRLAHRLALFDQVVDLNTVLKPGLAVVDGLICQEGLGPIFGVPVEMNLILAGTDMVAVDTVAGLVMGFEPNEIPITRAAAERGMGIADLELIEVVGAQIDEVKRRFLRVQEDERVKVENFRLIQNETTCTGCKTTIMSCIFDLKMQDRLHVLEGLTIMTGKDVDEKQLDGIAPETIITVGKCIPFEKRGQRWVKGCPPNNVWVIEAITGEKAKRAYSTADGLEENASDLDEMEDV
ncbi:MAG: DUF362 domain-containing protein [Bacillota bacterium]